MGRVTRRRRVVRIGGDGEQVTQQATVDTVAVEEPLEVRLAGRPFQVTMRTPGEDIDLVHGLLHSEQVISDARQVLLARYCAGTGADGTNTYNVVDVTLGEGALPPAEVPLVNLTRPPVNCGLFYCQDPGGRYAVDPRLPAP